ncbi:MAG: tetratricopeptide repeat protein [Rhodospirillaceae bacterium]
MVSEKSAKEQAFELVGAEDWEGAYAAFLDLVNRNGSEDTDVWYGLSLAHAGLGRREQSDAALERAYRLNPKDPRVAAAVGLRLLENGAAEQAVQIAQKALTRAPDDASLLFLLGDAYDALDQKRATLKVCSRLSALRPDDVLPRLKAARVRMRGLDLAGAEEEFRAALAVDPVNAAALEGLADVWRLTGKVDDARDVLIARASADPDPRQAAIFRFKAAATQPVIARDKEEIGTARARYLAALAAGPEAPIEDPYAAGLGPNFFLNYQAMNDRAAQEALAAYHLAATPSLGMQAAHLGQATAGRRIRVGIVSAFFSKHTVGYLSYGLIAGLDRARFDVKLFRVPRASQDSTTPRFAAAAPLIDLPADLAAARAVIAREELDIVHYPEIGMDHFSYFLAYARLGTLQTTSWGHPVTTGLPHIDLFLSVDGMEPPRADEHYSEALVRLKNMSFAGETPAPLPTRKEDCGLDEGPAYVCAQSLYKVHPDFDAVVAKILAKDSQARIYFVSIGGPADAIFKARLSNVVGGDIDRVAVLPRTTPSGFLKLVGAADVALDVPQWSGGKTSLETFQMGTPIVHMPGAFMRGRHTLAFYRRMNVMAPVVHDAERYAEIAVRLVHDASFRAEIRGQIEANRVKLFDDWASIREIEDVWLSALAVRT